MRTELCLGAVCYVLDHNSYCTIQFNNRPISEPETEFVRKHRNFRKAASCVFVRNIWPSTHQKCRKLTVWVGRLDAILRVRTCQFMVYIGIALTYCCHPRKALFLWFYHLFSFHFTLTFRLSVRLVSLISFFLLIPFSFVSMHPRCCDPRLRTNYVSSIWLGELTSLFEPGVCKNWLTAFSLICSSFSFSCTV